MRELKGLATGIGSLPYIGGNANKALDLIFKYTPNIPFWPQFPKRDIREGMVAQFIQRLPIPQAVDGGFFSHPSSGYPATERELEEFGKRLEEFYEKIITKDTSYFCISQDYAEGLHVFKERLKKEESLLTDIEFIKCQITGPFTFSANLKDENGIAFLHQPVFLQAIIKGLEMKALWQRDFFKEFGKKIIIFVDEPYLGCFGSAYTPVNKQDVVKGLRELTEGIKSDDVLIGIHCCGNADWSIFMDIKTIDIINFDAFGYLDKFVLYAENLNGFLKRGGVICWGIVPTQEFTGKETAELLVAKIREGIDTLSKKGLDKDLLIKNLLISPACGMAMLEPEKSEKILKVLSETSYLIRENL